MAHESTGPRHLYRSRDNRVLAGIIGGMGEYLDVDPVALRAVYVLLMALTGFVPLFAAYVIMLFIVPEPPGKK